MPKQIAPSTVTEARLAASTTIPEPSPAARPGSAAAPIGASMRPEPAGGGGMGGEGVSAGAGSHLTNGLGSGNPADKGGSSADALPQNFTAPKEGSEAGSATGSSLSFDTKEKNVRRGFGLSEDFIRELRQQHLVQGVDWELKKRAVCYSSRGMATLRAVIAAGSQKNTAPPSAPPTALLAAAKELEPVTLIVWKVKLTNRKLIFAHRPGADADNKPEARLRVQVRNPEMFIKGMEIPCRPLDGSGTFYELACTEPRRKGRLPV